LRSLREKYVIVFNCVALGLLICAVEPTIGPERGSLVIVGGGRLPAAVIDEFIARAGGKDAAFVQIPTANAGEDWGESYLDRSFLKRRGVSNLTVLHTRDRSRADADEFVAPLHRATGVWIDGGRQWRLADAYLDTRTYQALQGVLDRGGVIGGSSAGATILGSYLVRGAPEGNHILMAPGHETGFGFLKAAAIDQHVIARQRHLDLFPVIDQHPDLLGLGIDESTAIVVQGDHFRVIGDSRVLVHNGGELSDEPELPFFSLHPGEEFDLVTRRRIVSRR
jgi:cyanophycinase